MISVQLWLPTVDIIFVIQMLWSQDCSDAAPILNLRPAWSYSYLLSSVKPLNLPPSIVRREEQSKPKLTRTSASAAYTHTGLGIRLEAHVSRSKLWPFWYIDTRLPMEGKLYVYCYKSWSAQLGNWLVHKCKQAVSKLWHLECPSLETACMCPSQCPINLWTACVQAWARLVH